MPQTIRLTFPDPWINIPFTQAATNRPTISPSMTTFTQENLTKSVKAA
jgi:hypothetical protein